MRVRMLGLGKRRTLDEEQKTQPAAADRAQAAPSGGQALRWGFDPRDLPGTWGPRALERGRPLPGPKGMGAREAGRPVGQQEACAPALERSGAQSTRPTTQEETPWWR